MFHFFEPRKPLGPAFLAITTCPVFAMLLSSEWTAWIVIRSYSSYLLTLGISIGLYRISPFHPLASFPGLLIFKITKLAGLWASYTGKQHLIMSQMHEKYGPIVRVGEIHCLIHNFYAHCPIRPLQVRWGLHRRQRWRYHWGLRIWQ